VFFTLQAVLVTSENTEDQDADGTCKRSILLDMVLKCSPREEGKQLQMFENKV
jgi:hypothetical protein